MTGQTGAALSGTALMVFAHADDETLLAGALIAKLVADGWRVHLLCVAPGDDADRYARMELAAAELGVESISSLRFSPAPDRGEPQLEPASPALLSAPESAVVNLIEGKLAEIAPSMIVTHSPDGDYGHPDHALCHRLTVAAAAAAAPSAAVYALAWPRAMLWLNSLAERLLSLPAKKPDVKARERRVAEGGEGRGATLSSRLPVTGSHDVRRFLSVRKRAVRHYNKEISQGPLPLRLLEAAPTWLQRPVLGKARLSRVR
ncbi:MAG: PIG-L family deacetylase [Chloroflexi bacterium]|nr:PIG-L family deacetylase [Chloroflexota bacterium]